MVVFSHFFSTAKMNIIHEPCKTLSHLFYKTHEITAIYVFSTRRREFFVRCPAPPLSKPSEGTPKLWRSRKRRGSHSPIFGVRIFLGARGSKILAASETGWIPPPKLWSPDISRRKGFPNFGNPGNGVVSTPKTFEFRERAHPPIQKLLAPRRWCFFLFTLQR